MLTSMNTQPTFNSLLQRIVETLPTEERPKVEVRAYNNEHHIVAFTLDGACISISIYQDVYLLRSTELLDLCKEVCAKALQYFKALFSAESVYIRELDELLYDYYRE